MGGWEQVRGGEGGCWGRGFEEGEVVADEEGLEVGGVEVGG